MLNCSVLDDSDYLYMCNNLAKDLQINCELALLIVLLKKLNQHNTILQKELLPEKLTKVQREYWENVKYICDLQEGCYGTVTEQIQTFEDMMPYYLNKKITEEKLFAIDNILEELKEEKIDFFQNFMSLGGLLFTVFFGLPAIQDTLIILRNLCSFIQHDIPYVTVDNTSVAMWLIIIAIFIKYSFFKK